MTALPEVGDIERRNEIVVEKKFGIWKGKEKRKDEEFYSFFGRKRKIGEFN